MPWPANYAAETHTRFLCISWHLQTSLYAGLCVFQPVPIQCVHKDVVFKSDPTYMKPSFKYAEISAVKLESLMMTLMDAETRNSENKCTILLHTT